MASDLLVSLVLAGLAWLGLMITVLHVDVLSRLKPWDSSVDNPASCLPRL